MTRETMRTLKKQRFTSLEKWGDTERVVIRDGLGHFIHNVNLTSLRRNKVVKSR
jgi:hypothetical protein